MRKIIIFVLCAMLLNPITVLANQNGHFMPQNQQFTSGPDYRHVLGRHTYVDTFEPDTTTQNIRRDAQSSFSPPSQGVWSGTVPTDRVNPLVRVSPPINPWLPITTPQPQQAAPIFDSGGLGGFLLPTSILE